MMERKGDRGRGRGRLVVAGVEGGVKMEGLGVG